MPHETELTLEIIKSDMAKKILKGLPAKYGDAYVALWIIQAIGTQLDKVDRWTSWDDSVKDSFKNQIVPQTATWSLPYWEATYGIKTDESLPIESRRQAVVNKKLERAAMPPAKIELILSSLCGWDVKIEERTGKNAFKVYVSANPNIVDEKALKKRLDTLKPAHLVYQMIYERYSSNTLYAGGMVRTCKEITLTQV